MSAITVGGDLVHYEVLGRGRPVILVHGWLGSWRYWVPTMQTLHTKYRVYALDLFGFGDSGKNADKYTLEQQVRLLSEFMSQLGLPKAALVGHGLGAMVVSQFAVDNQEKAARILIASAPLFDPGDLDERTPADQHKLLTHNIGLSTPPAPVPAAAVVPSPTPPVGNPTLAEPTIVRRPEGLEDSAALKPASQPASSPGNQAGSLPVPADHTVPSASPADAAQKDDSAKASPAQSATFAETNQAIVRRTDDMRARLNEAAMKAAAQARAEGAPTPVMLPETDHRPDTLSKRLISLTTAKHNPLKDSLAQSRLDVLLAKCFKASEPEYDKLKTDVDKTDNAVLKQSVDHFDSGRMLDMLRLLKMPVVVVHGADDPIIEQPNEKVWHYLTDKKEDLVLPIPLPGVRHFPMLEHEPFQRLVSQFLELDDISKLEVKERWVRRTR